MDVGGIEPPAFWMRTKRSKAHGSINRNRVPLNYTPINMMS